MKSHCLFLILKPCLPNIHINSFLCRMFRSLEVLGTTCHQNEGETAYVQHTPSAGYLPLRLGVLERTGEKKYILEHYLKYFHFDKASIKTMQEILNTFFAKIASGLFPAKSENQL